MMKANSTAMRKGRSSTSTNEEGTICSLPRTVALRFLLIGSLLTAATACSVLAYVSLKSSEEDVARQTFESIAASALSGAQAQTVRKVQGSEVMATLLSYAVPDPASWPLIDVAGYIHIASKVAALSSSTTQSLMVLLNPEQVTEFEEYTKQVYIEQERPETAGYSDFGFGIWKKDADAPYDDNRSHDTNGETSWGGTAGILTPLMFHNQPGAGSLMYNVYSEANRGVPLDSMFTCVKDNAEANGGAYPSCAVVTDMLELKVRPGPAALLFQPVYPANDPTTLVGFATTSVHWQEVLESVVPDYVNGLTCVVKTDTSSYTYEIVNGYPELVGSGDLHDPDYESFAESVTLNDFMESGASGSAIYTLTVYPSQVMFDTFTTKSPIAISLAFFGVIFICTCIFLAYDFLMRNEARHRKTVLEMKRRFVRFISHEIRTPLSTVCMGLELLESELRSPQKDNRCKETDEVVNDDDIEFWYNVTTDVKENAHVAVTILNDLLNYDKLETGTMKIETENIGIWNLIEATVNQLNIQAVNRNIDLKLNVQQPRDKPEMADPEEGGSDTELIGVGDDVRIMQVFRNIISNALKFTPPDGTIDVTARHIVDGLSQAKPLMKEDHDGNMVPACSYPRAGSIEIVVKDSGVGLTEEQLAQLFGEGVQFDANKLQHGGGSGLGLSIAKGIVIQHQGTIKAESEGHGKGTSFVIELPLYSCPSNEVKRLQSDKTVATTKASDTELSLTYLPSSRSRRILVAEDAVSSRKMLIRLLERAGHACVPAGNGREAVDAVVRDLNSRGKTDHIPIDTILMDFEMPLLKGPDATRKVRELGFTGTILGVTGNVMSEDVEFFKQHGADEVLPKPISMQLLDNYWDGTSDAVKRRSFHSSISGAN